MKQNMRKKKTKYFMLAFFIIFIFGYLTAIRISLAPDQSFNLSHSNGTKMALSCMMIGYIGTFVNILEILSRRKPLSFVEIAFGAILLTQFIFAIYSFSTYQGPYLDPLGMMCFFSLLPMLVAGTVKIQRIHRQITNL